MNKIITRHAIAAAVALCAQPALAQLLNDVVVTATRTPREIGSIVSDVSILDSDRLRNAGQSSLADLLRFESAVQASSNGGPASNTSLFVRGANSGQTLLLIEGFRMGSVSVGGATFEGIPPMAFGRAELMRGPASSLYGADAIGGTLQLFLPRGSGAPSGWAQTGVGSWRGFSLDAGGSGGSERGDVSVSAGRSRSAGYDATTPAYFLHNPDRDGWERRYATFNGNLKLAPGHEVGLVLMEHHLSSAFDDASYDDARTRLVNRLVGVRSTHRLMPDWTLKLRAGNTTDDSRSMSSFPGQFRSDQRQFGADLDGRLAGNVTASLGVERLDERVGNSAYDGDAAASRRTQSIRGLVIVDAGAHTVQFNARYDDSSQYGGRWNGGLGYGLKLGGGWRVVGSAATGFKAVSFNDLYYPNYGRTTIRPESSRAIDLGIVRELADSRLKLVAFRSDVRDLVVYAAQCPDPSPQFLFGCADNVGRARLQGLSAGWDARWGATRLVLNADWLDARDVAQDLRLARRASRTGSAMVEHRIGDAAFAIEWFGSGARYDDVGNTRRLGGYALVNLRAELQLSRQASVFVRANNVFDRRYETAYAFVTPRANLFAGVRLGW